MVKRVTLIIEIKFDFVSEHLLDNPDEFADAVPKSIVVRPAFGSLGLKFSRLIYGWIQSGECKQFP